MRVKWCTQRRDNGSTSNCPLGLSRLFHAASSHCQRLGMFVCGGARPKIGTYWIMLITKLNKLAESCVLLSTRKRAGKCFMLCSYPHTTHRSCYGDRDEKWWKSFNLGISLNSPAQVGMMTLIFCGVDSVRRWTDGHTPRLQWQQWQHEKFDGIYFFLLRLRSFWPSNESRWSLETAAVAVPDLGWCGAAA